MTAPAIEVLDAGVTILTAGIGEAPPHRERRPGRCDAATLSAVPRIASAVDLAGPAAAAVIALGTRPRRFYSPAR